MRLFLLMWLVVLALAFPSGARAEAPFPVTVSIVSVTPSPSYVGQAVSIRVSVATGSPQAVPTGMVEVQSSGSAICAITLDASGAGECALTFSTPGIYPLQAVYPGATNYLPGVSAETSHTVRARHAATVTFTAHNPSPSVLNQVVNAQVRVSSPGPVPGGSLAIFRGDAACTLPPVSFSERCDATLSGGNGACSLPLKLAGAVNLCAAYSGDYATLPATGKVTHWVSSSNTALGIQRVDPSPSLLGQSAWVYFTLTSPAGTPPPSSIIKVTSGALSCSAALSAGRCALTFNQPHLQNVVATFAGATSGAIVFQPSTSNTWVQRVNAPPTSLVLTSDQLDAFMPVGQVAGTFSVTDPNPDETHAYTLVAGAGSSANSFFTIQGSRLLLARALNQTNGELPIRVRATDSAGLFIERALTLSINAGMLPETGFAPSTDTALPVQAAEKAYRAFSSLAVEIPALGVNAEVLGVPWNADGWDATWLGDSLGWLDGSAFPGWQGNSVLVGHNYLSTGSNGPLANLAALKWGDRILVHAFGVTSIYEVRAVNTVKAGDPGALRHEDKAWLTLITCRNYNEQSQSYQNRVIARAVLIETRASPGT